jgi:alpha-L-rhamnosidase
MLRTVGVALAIACVAFIAELAVAAGSQLAGDSASRTVVLYPGLGALAGLSPAEPGWSRIAIAPTPLAGFDYARSQQVTPYGIAASGWRRDGDEIVVEVVVPANTRASVILPWGDAAEVCSGSHEFRGSATPEPAIVRDYSRATPMAVLADDPQAFATVRRVLTDFSPDYTSAFFARTKWTMGSAPGDVMFGVPPHVMEQLERELALLGDPRRP